MINQIFYHYFSGIENKDGCNYSLNSLIEGKVSFSHVSYFNDPCEIALFPNMEPFNTFNSDTKYKYELYSRVFCFSETFQNPLMWAHYGNSHQGFCVGYASEDIKNISEHKDTLCFRKVLYVNDIPSLSKEEIDQGYALYYKSSEWEKENEWRATICLNPADFLISKEEFIIARNKWLDRKIFFERAVDSHLRLPFNSLENISGIENKVQLMRQGIKNFEIDNYAYSAFTEITTKKTVFGKLPMRVECSLKAKSIYIGLHTSDQVRKVLKKYAKSNDIDIFEMGIKHGKYAFVPQKIII